MEYLYEGGLGWKQIYYIQAGTWSEIFKRSNGKKLRSSEFANMSGNLLLNP